MSSSIVPIDRRELPATPAELHDTAHALDAAAAALSALLAAAAGGTRASRLHVRVTREATGAVDVSVDFDNR
jgi:hypothetical protein